MSEKSHGRRVKVPVDSIPKAHSWLPDGALAPGVQNWGCERAGGVYIVRAQDAKMEILAGKQRGGNAYLKKELRRFQTKRILVVLTLGRYSFSQHC